MQLSSRNNRFRKMEANEVGRPHSQIFRDNVAVPNLLDARVQPQYDFWSVPASTATVAVTLFTIPQGQQYTPPTGTAITKTAFHTSLQGQGGVFPAPVKLLVKNISFMNDPGMVPADLNQSILNYLITFTAQNKTFTQQHMAKFPGGAGGQFSAASLVGTTAITGASRSYFSTSNGWPTAMNYNPITADNPGAADASGNPLPPITGVLIESGQPFSVVADPTLHTGTGFSTSGLTAAADGYLAPGILWICYLEGITLVAVV